MRNKFLFSIFVFFFITSFILLGTWQIVRLNWKLELINQIETSLKYQPINLSNNVHKDYLKIKTSGILNFEKQIYLYSLNEKGEPGFEVITPIITNNKNYLLNRGWITFDKKNTQEINIVNSKNIIGTLKKQLKANRFKPINNITENYWFSLNRRDIFQYTGKNFSPFIIYLNNNLDVPKTKKITKNISNNHKKYAVTWFSLAFSVFVFYIYFRKKKY